MTDYKEHLEPVEFQTDIKKRHFQIEVGEESIMALRAYAKQQQKPAKHVVCEMIEQKIAS